MADINLLTEAELRRAVQLDLEAVDASCRSGSRACPGNLRSL